jgi:prepilin-type N-terminal cleavage/methylation domain-containing protein
MPVKMKKLRLTSKTRRAWQGRSRGFTLIEVVIAIALIGIIGAAILSALSTASLALIIADRRATAESIARTQMESVRDQDYKEADNFDEVSYLPITDIPDGYTIWSINREDMPVEDVIGVPWNSGNNTAADVDAGLQRIKLVIKNDDDVIVTLEDYKRQPIVESE